jgi:putative FmdB family regulatory protein
MESAHFTVKSSLLRGLKMASRTTHATQTNPGENLMPIFEYACRTCGKEFEKLVRQSDPVPVCPACQSGELTKKMSTFAALSSGSVPAYAEAPAGCGSCGNPNGAGACQLN